MIYFAQFFRPVSAAPYRGATMQRSAFFAAILIFGFALAGWPGAARAGYVPESMPIADGIAHADAIAVCKIITVTPIPMLPNDNPAYLSKPITDSNEIMQLTALQPKSNYEFEIVQTIKGAVTGKKLSGRLPLISSEFYYDDAKFKVRAGGYCILMLLNSSVGHLIPIDHTVPMIPLGDAAPAAAGGGAEAAVYRLMLDSLADPALRRANLYLLRKSTDPTVLWAMKRYVSDPDRRVRASVLRCMAMNQDVKAIPLIAALEIEGGDGPSDALEYYKTRKAVPYLNQVAVSEARYGVVNAVLVLHQIGDRSSIPYLYEAAQNSQDWLSGVAMRKVDELIAKSWWPPISVAGIFEFPDAEEYAMNEWLQARLGRAH
jgi:hypothetical protein